MWNCFALDMGIDPTTPPMHYALSFLQNLYDENHGYWQINTACSALSAVVDTHTNISFGNLPVVKRFMKGIFQLIPSFPKYSFVWDVNKVFNFFRKQPNITNLNLKALSLKLAMLMMLLSGGQRSQTIHCIKRSDINFIDVETVYICIMEKIKQTKPGNHMKPLKFISYEMEPCLCVISHLKEYLKRTRELAPNEPKLFISFIKPHKAVSKDTIARWCKVTLSQCGIDVTKYTTHSSRAAATSKAKVRGVSVKRIIDSAGWKNERMFATCYERTIEEEITLI